MTWPYVVENEKKRNHISGKYKNVRDKELTARNKPTKNITLSHIENAKGKLLKRTFYISKHSVKPDIFFNIL